MDLIASIRAGVRDPGYRIVPAAETQELVGPEALARWNGFADSWNDLGVDQFMADGGRYRRRRFGCFAVSPAGIIRKPHQPHYQGRDHNPLNGGIDRWFEPITDVVAEHPVTTQLLAACLTVFGDGPWHAEMHQFRIEPDASHEGKPTPEGMHRDGVDWVFVALVARHNVAGGVTAIGDNDQRPLGRFELADPLDAVFLDDHRVWHGVTPLQVRDPGHPAYRDALVITFRAEERPPITA